MNAIFFIFLENQSLNPFPRFGIDWMRDITILIIHRSTAWHRDKESLFALNDFNIVYYKLIIKRDGNDCLHLPLFSHLAYTYISYLHAMYRY